MGILDIFRKKQIDTAEIQFWNGNPDTGLFNNFQRERVLEILDNCGATNYEQRNPRDQILLGRTIYEIFPFAKRAVNEIASMVGNVKLEAVTPGAISDDELANLNDLIKELPILSEWDWEKPHAKGFNVFVERLARTMLLDGMVFCETRFQEGDLRNYLGTLLFNSPNFDFVRETLGPYRLKYRANQYPDESPLYPIAFSQAGFDYRNAYPWAASLFAGAGFYTHLLITMLIAVKNINSRKGAPVEFSLISVKDDSKLQDPKTQKSYTDAMEGIQKALKDATRLQLEGRPFSGIAKMPMDVQLLSKAFGVDAIKEVDTELLTFILVGFVNLLDIPIEFIGIVLGSSGFSPERFKILYKIWGTKVDNLRNKIEPIATKEKNLFLLSRGVNPRLVEAVKVGFETPDFVDDQGRADTEKTQAETAKLHTEIAAYLSQLDTQAAADYLLRVGLIEEEINIETLNIETDGTNI